MFIGPGFGNIPHDEWRCFVPNRSSPGEGNYNFLERKCCQMATRQKNVMPDLHILNEGPIFIRFGSFMWACFNHFIATYIMSIQGRRNEFGRLGHDPTLFFSISSAFSYSIYVISYRWNGRNSLSQMNCHSFCRF